MLSMDYMKKMECLARMNQLETRTIRTDELKVGDIIKVKDDETIPADCFVMASGSSLEAQTDG